VGKLKRYLAFAYDRYYPCGGWSDFIGSFDDIDEAQAAIAKTKADFGDIVDTETGEPVEITHP
jgi:hypothetical protein